MREKKNDRLDKRKVVNSFSVTASYTYVGCSKPVRFIFIYRSNPPHIIFIGIRLKIIAFPRVLYHSFNEKLLVRNVDKQAGLPHLRSFLHLKIRKTLPFTGPTIGIGTLFL